MDYTKKGAFDCGILNKFANYCIKGISNHTAAVEPSYIVLLTFVLGQLGLV